MQTQIVAKALIVDSPDLLLLLRRSQTDSRRPGEWDFAGGEIEEGEELSQGVIREILEETGLNIKSSEVKLIYAATTAYDELSVTRLLFIAITPSKEVKLSNEHDQYQWVDFNTALELFPHPFYGVGLKYAIDHNLLKAQSHQ